jgi:hypothetical protein
MGFAGSKAITGKIGEFQMEGYIFDWCGVLARVASCLINVRPEFGTHPLTFTIKKKVHRK